MVEDASPFPVGLSADALNRLRGVLSAEEFGKVASALIAPGAPIATSNPTVSQPAWPMGGVTTPTGAHVAPHVNYGTPHPNSIPVMFYPAPTGTRRRPTTSRRATVSPPLLARSLCLTAPRLVARLQADLSDRNHLIAMECVSNA